MILEGNKAEHVLVRQAIASNRHATLEWENLLLIRITKVILLLLQTMQRDFESV